MNNLTSEEIKKYHKDGFVIVRSVFTEKECEDFKKVLKEEIVNGKNELEKSSSDAINTIDTDKIADIPRMINKGILQDIAHRNSSFMNLAKDNRLINMIGQLFGNDVSSYRLYRSLSFFKNSEIFSKSQLHQDMPYWRGGHDKLSIWISLNRVTKENGSLIFFPGTHKNPKEHVTKGKKNLGLYKEIENVDHSKKIIAEVETGDIVIFHSWVVHGSEENILKSERYAITFTYQPGKDTSHHRSGPAELIEPKAIYK